MSVPTDDQIQAAARAIRDLFERASPSDPSPREIAKAALEAAAKVELQK